VITFTSARPAFQPCGICLKGEGRAIPQAPLFAQKGKEAPRRQSKEPLGSRTYLPAEQHK
jgi:hypothetical protein